MSKLLSQLNEIEETVKQTLDQIINQIAESKKTKKSISFSNVDVFLFKRTQGFGCIPSDGLRNSITLGMSAKHFDLEKFSSVDEYLKFKRKIHLLKLEEEKIKIINKQTEAEAASLCSQFLKSNEKKRKNQKVCKFLYHYKHKQIYIF